MRRRRPRKLAWWWSGPSGHSNGDGEGTRCYCTCLSKWCYGTFSSHLSIHIDIGIGLGMRHFHTESMVLKFGSVVDLEVINIHRVGEIVAGRAEQTMVDWTEV